MKAFPHPDYMKTNDEVVTQIKYLEQGMDLRDYFAAKVMQYWMANPMSSMHIENMCKGAYQIADALMEARKK